jgi:2'-5' RNA ligase
MKRPRTFIAVDTGKAIRDRLVSLQERLAQSGAPVKWVEAENLHVTLLFLGEVDQREVPAVCHAVADVCKDRPPFTLAVEGVSCFGNPRRPRTLWVGVGVGTEDLCALHDALEPPLLDLGCYRREARKFTPHITIGRVTSERPSDALAAALAKHARWQAGEVPVREILVLSSELTHDGPIYTVLSRAKLLGA